MTSRSRVGLRHHQKRHDVRCVIDAVLHQPSAALTRSWRRAAKNLAEKIVVQRIRICLLAIQGAMQWPAHILPSWLHVVSIDDRAKGQGRWSWGCAGCILLR